MNDLNEWATCQCGADIYLPMEHFHCGVCANHLCNGCEHTFQCGEYYYQRENVDESTEFTRSFGCPYCENILVKDVDLLNFLLESMDMTKDYAIKMYQRVKKGEGYH